MAAEAKLLSFVLLFITILHFEMFLLTENFVGQQSYISKHEVRAMPVSFEQRTLRRRSIVNSFESTRDYLISASVPLHYTSDQMSPLCWRHFNPGILHHSGKFYYVGRIGKLMREKQADDKQVHTSRWNKINRLFFANLLHNSSTGEIYFESVQMKFDPFENEKKILLKGVKFIDPPELQGNADCEMINDALDGGHGYQSPKLLFWDKAIYLIFSSRKLVSNRTQCQPGKWRFLYIAEVVLPNLPSGNVGSASCKTPVELNLGENEKSSLDWIPFVYKNGLYFSVSFFPEHIVVDCTDMAKDRANECHEKYKSNSTSIFMDAEKEIGERVRDAASKTVVGAKEFSVSGGTKAVFVSETTGRKGYYIGAVHFSSSQTDSGKLCLNFLYTMEMEPPFRITSFRELDLISDLSPGFANLSANGPIFYKKFYPANERCPSVSDITLVYYDEKAHNCKGPERCAHRALLLAYGVSEAETRIREIIL